MIGTLLRIGWLNLKRDYVALALTFVLPVVFFSIFAVIFGGMGESASGGTEGVSVAVVDLDGSEASRRLRTALGEGTGLSVMPGSPSLDEARSLVRKGEVPVAVVLPKGFGETFLGADAEPVEILYDESDPIAHQMVAGLIQGAAMSAAPDLMMRRGVAMLERYGGALTDAQRTAVEAGAKNMIAEGGSGSGGGGPMGPVPVRVTNVRAPEGDDASGGASMVAYYAAGIGVMFLLFSMAGAGSSLLEEEENGTLERVLTSHVSMGSLLVGRWIFFWLIGGLQVTLMFVWGAALFGLDLWSPNHLAGFLAMTVLTAAAAAAFGILLATLCRTRAQLGGMSTIVILIMSALGGSMVPRFVMPDFMNTTALFTFNGWALDGFLKVFWYDDPSASVAVSLVSILPELIALALMTVSFLGLARLFARRWEAD